MFGNLLPFLSFLEKNFFISCLGSNKKMLMVGYCLEHIFISNFVALYRCKGAFWLCSHFKIKFCKVKVIFSSKYRTEDLLVTRNEIVSSSSFFFFRISVQAVSQRSLNRFLRIVQVKFIIIQTKIFSFILMTSLPFKSYWRLIEFKWVNLSCKLPINHKKY